MSFGEMRKVHKHDYMQYMLIILIIIKKNHHSLLKKCWNCSFFVNIIDAALTLAQLAFHIKILHN